MQEENLKQAALNSDACCSTDHRHDTEHAKSKFLTYLPAVLSFVMLLTGIALNYFEVEFFKHWIPLVWYGVAFVPVGFPVIKQALENIVAGDFFTEFFLMTIATLGAFAIGEYPEAVAVMLFYTIGELFQHSAVDKARGNIQSLLDVRPNSALVYRNNAFVSVHPEEILVGETIQVRVGEKIPLDGKLLSDVATLNTAAITGESKPDTIREGEKVFAGSINLESVIEMEATKVFKNSSIAKILDMVQNATARKSKTELFIRKFARIYTPIVVFMAIGLTLLPYFFIDEYIFRDWLYRALIFLVISCPCALVISIPLGYFGGLGAASRNGILFKGASFLDSVTKINTLVMDKTGTITKGVFKIKDIVSTWQDPDDMMHYLKAIESQSTHPIAKAIVAYGDSKINYLASEVKEIAGHGLSGIVNDKTVLAGNKKLMFANAISIPIETEEIVDSIIMIAIDGKFAGYVVLGDELKDDAQLAIDQLRGLGISKIIMLSGDKPSITEKIGSQLGLDSSIGGLLPEDKLENLEALKRIPGTVVAFVGDGLNDAPVIAASDVGIAMGGLGSDITIETADVIIQTDQPSKIARAIKIGRSTRNIVWQNIGLAFGVKLIVLILGAGGLATMWEAVFADVGVAFLAILNAIRLQRMKWE